MEIKKQINNQIFDEERALYNLVDTEVVDCTFAGPADGESALKECRNIAVKNCAFSLRYPLWHVKGFLVENSSFDERARAAVWYGENGAFKNCTCNGIKILRECQHILMEGCESISPEFGWKCADVTMRDSKVTAEYIFFDSRDITLENFELKGKYQLDAAKKVIVFTFMYDKVPLNTFVAYEAQNLNIVFEADRLLEFIKNVATAMSKNASDVQQGQLKAAIQTAGTVGTLLQNYDGLMLGAELTKTAAAGTKTTKSSSTGGSSSATGDKVLKGLGKMLK